MAHLDKSKSGSKRTSKGYRGITAGTRKEILRKLFDKKGKEAVITKGLALDVKRSTLRVWTDTWRREKAEESGNAN